MIAKTLADLPQTYRCLKCCTDKPISEMVLVRRKRTQDFMLHSRCKACHNEFERGHRREWKREYQRRWRRNNPELNDSYWKPFLHERRRLARMRAAIRRADPLIHSAQLIQGRLRRRLDMHVSIHEAKQLCRKFGQNYPTRFGLTPEGIRECERIRSRSRRIGKPLKAIEIRMMVYEDGFFITPRRQKFPYYDSAEKLRDWWKTRRSA